MLGVALLTSALFAFGTARIYNRCELAGDLLRLGVDKDHLATWVCIAFHESRFDTAARNPHSGDHGLLQISELYWCGPGKACGVPCSAFRDEDISDDVECAQRIHKEHTRLQGDGFLAWVVYPHHCRHNAKKYLADCDGVLKDHAYKPDERGRSLKTRYRVEQPKNETIPFYEKIPNIDDLKPPYIAINALLRGRYDDSIVEKIDHVKTYNNDEKKHPFEWLNNHLFKTSSGNFPTYKISNIDQLKPPVHINYNSRTSFKYNEPSTTTTIRTTTIDPALKDIKPPNPRRIESNQFRRRKTFKTFPETSSDVQASLPLSTTTTQQHPTSRDDGSRLRTSTFSLGQSFAKPYLNLSSLDIPKRVNNKESTISNRRQDTPPVITELSSKNLSSDNTTVQNNVLTTASPFSNQPTRLTFRLHTSVFSTHNAETSTIKYGLNSLNESKFINNQLSSTTSKPESLPRTTPTPRLSFQEQNSRNDFDRTTIISSTSTPSNADSRIFSNRGSFKIRQENESTTIKPRPTRPWITFAPRSNFTFGRSIQPEFSTSKPTPYSPTTVRTTSTGMATARTTTTTTTRTTTTTPQPNISTTSKITSTTKFSIFDLYLKPTKRPNIVIKIPEFKDSPSRLRIFSGGTTALPPSFTISQKTSTSSPETRNTNPKIS